MSLHRNPNVVRLSEVLSQRIRQRYYEAGTWLPTERVLCEEFSVERAIVRAALSELQRQSLIVRTPGSRPYVAEETGATYAPAVVTRSAVSQSIAIIIPHHHHFPASQAVLRGFYETLRLRDVPGRVTVFDNYSGNDLNDVERQSQALESLDTEEVGGVVLWQMGNESDPPHVRKLRERGIPVIFLDRYPAGCDGDHIGIDNRYSAVAAVSYLIELGHTCIGFLGGRERNVSTVLEREQGYRDAMQLHGLTPAPDLTFQCSRTDHGRDYANYFLSLSSPPTAVFAVNDYSAYELISGLTSSGVRVPDDISVIGFDDIDQFSPRAGLLTTTRQPFERMGARAAELLLERMGSAAPLPAAWRHILLPTQLVARETCRALQPSTTVSADALVKGEAIRV